MLEVNDWILSELPPPPARVLEIGCGGGELTRRLSAAGYDALGIDPRAPRGPLFRAVALEELDDARFDAAVAVLALHHVHDLARSLDRIASLAPLLVLDEFSWDRCDEATADWYERHRLALLATGAEPYGPPARAWTAHHEGLHVADDFRQELPPRFEERSFSWEPYLHRELGSPSLEPVERELIAAGAIRATGFRYVGTRG